MDAGTEGIGREPRAPQRPTAAHERARNAAGPELLAHVDVLGWAAAAEERPAPRDRDARGDDQPVVINLLPAARADLLRRLGRRDEAAAAYRAALALTGNQAERRYLERRLGEVS